MASKRKASLERRHLPYDSWATSEADSVIEAPSSSKKSKKAVQSNNASSDSECMTQGRPQWDFEREYGSALDIPDELFTAQQENHRKPLSELPGWKWIVCERSDDIYSRCKDYTGYAINELVENSKRDVEGAFLRIEGLAHFFVEEDMMQWLNIDDGDRLGLTNTLVMRAFLTTFHLLHKKGLFKEDSVIKSLRTCINSFLHYMEETDADTFFEDPEEAQSAQAIVAAYCYKKDFEYELAHSIRTFVESRDVPDDLNVDDPSDDPFNFEEPFKELTQQYGSGRPKNLGGVQYDITKISSADRKKYAFDNVDPMKAAASQLKEAEKELQGEKYP
ncbi:Hypothetical protein D9617_6g093500 [Elsinoe fawcettii]|nr:Hypothetical protein D9617_6g093500 [Elsinoe fawcettii]